MPIIELFHERERRRLKGETPDVYEYDDLPQALRNQIIYILSDVFRHMPQAWEKIHAVFMREMGLQTLCQCPSSRQDCLEYIETDNSVEHVLSLVELLLLYATVLDPNWHAPLTPDAAIEEFNARFQKARVGYRFERDCLIRVDSEYIHAEVTKPALLLLADPQFTGPNDEFKSAHKHYREGKYKEAINDALKAFESTMKTICTIKQISFDPKAQAKDLITLMVDNKIIPVEKDSHFAGFRSAMESGLPTTRNKQAGHGQGPEVKDVPRHVAAHALHLAAANIVFLVESAKAMP